jgi:hypothetical protein
VWGDVSSPTPWGKGLAPAGVADGASFWRVPVKHTATHVGLLVYKGDVNSGEEKAAGVLGRGVALLGSGVDIQPASSRCTPFLLTHSAKQLPTNRRGAP